MRLTTGRCWMLTPILVWASVPTALGTPTLYRLTSASEYQTGCLKGPCDCAVNPPVPIIGTFFLELQQVGPLFTDYHLTGISWYATLPEGRVHFRGQGLYRLGGEVAVTHQLQLTLTDDNGIVHQFDSEIVPGGGEFPQIDIQTWVTGADCVTAAIHVVAEPAPYTVYRLGQRTTYTQGCTGGLCDCAIDGPVPMQGTFLLVHVGEDPLYSTYALKDIRWTALFEAAPVHITGDGLYRYGGEVVVMHQLELDILVEGQSTSDHLDSGLVLAFGFPAIDVFASTNTNCFNREVNLQARPAGDFDLDGTVGPDDFNTFEACFTGPGILQLAWNCQAADIDGDGDVDQDDFGMFQRCMTGPHLPMDRDCAG